jgi:hypothetical protein
VNVTTPLNFPQHTANAPAKRTKILAYLAEICPCALCFLRRLFRASILLHSRDAQLHTTLRSTAPTMDTKVPTFDEMALQLETAGAHLRVLSTFSEAQRESKIMETAEQIKTVVEETQAQMTVLLEQVKENKSEDQSLRDTTENRLKAVEARYVSVYTIESTVIDI